MTRRFFSGLFLFFAVLLAAGQEPFPEREIKPFPPEVKEAFAALDRSLRPAADALADSAQLAWDAGGFSETQKDTIIVAIERMLGGRFRLQPDLENYLRVIVYISAQPDTRRLFARWHEALAYSMQNHTPTRTSEFMERSRLLFLENTLFRSGAVRWKVRNSRPLFDFHNNETIVNVNGADLVCLAYADSSVIYNTTGQAMLDKNAWKGQGGKLTWQRTLLDPEKVFAQLKGYEIDLTKAIYEADSVTFYHLDFFEQPLQGRISERVVAEFKPEDANYPVFESYQRAHVIRDVFPGIHYYGGFVLQGSKVQGAGTTDDAALIEVFRGDEKMISARAKNFVIRPDRILSEKASFTFFIGRDSIWHPGLNVRYLHEQRELSAMRDERGLSRAPFFNTYHRLDMYCEALYWKLDSAFMNLQMIRGVGQSREAIFESHDFFSQMRYHRVQGIDDINPLSRLAGFARMIGTQEFYLGEYSRHIRREATAVKQELFNLSFQGFIQFEEEEGRITLNERLYHYIAANARQADHDVMQIRSLAPVNARLDIESFELELMGVERIPLSTARNVVIYPHDQKVSMQANRNMAFDGRVESGLFNFYGKEFFFEYQEFKISMVNSDSLSFSVRSFEPDSRGRYEYVKVKNVLESVNGELLVDHPSNKSGRQPFSRYPTFSSTNESFVFFDSEGTHSGAYGRDSIFFQIMPFTIDSLDHASTDNIAFGGVFYSNDILPDFEDYLTVQRDYTLGFSAVTPEGGVPVYRGLATYSGPVTMSGEGLVTSGRFNYLSSVVDAEKLVLLPEEAVGTVRNFELAAGGEADYPAIQAEMVKVSLRPDENIMRISHTDEALVFYDGKAGFRGDIELTPTSLSGTGQLQVQQAAIQAGDFVFRQNNLVSQRSDMEVVGPGGKQAFVHRDFSAEMDMENLTGTFRPADNDANISFPAINLLAESYDYDWDIEAGLIDLRSSGRANLPAYGSMSQEELLNVDFSGFEMIFTDRQKDSLRFFAPSVFLELKDYNLHAEGVPLLRVADAAIFPEGGVLIVDAGGVIRKFENAEIIASTTNRHHKFTQASVEVNSSKSYNASGIYTYVDKNGKSTPVLFQKIGVDNQRQTLAEAILPDSLNFFMGPEFAFQGKAMVKAEQPFFEFDGFTKIDVPCAGLETGWFSFTSPINPNDIRIPVEPGMRNLDRRELTNAIMLAGDSIHVYAAILSRRKHYLDRELVSAYGYLVYDEATGDFLVGTSEKLADRNLHHNMIRISRRNCLIQGEGTVDLGVDLGRFQMDNYGTVNHNLQTNVTELELVMGLDFFFSDRVLTPFFASMDVSENPRLNLNSQKFRRFLSKNLGPESAGLMMSEFLSTGYLHRLPAAMQHPIMLGDVRLRWNQPTRSFISYGRIGLANLEQNQVMRQINGQMEVRRNRAGDNLTLLFRASESGDAGIGREWYYFHMSTDELKVLSSIHEFNEAVEQLRPRQRQISGGPGERSFSFSLAEERRPYDFFHLMRQIKIE
ncbi:MAG: hypothetical protein K0B09_07725 [Bacteroidales bacterium]|nr:hypothetical protein [Bacteroidales bacterium]